MKYVVGVDVGGTTIKIAIFDQPGKIVGFSEIATRTENQGASILPDTAAEIKKLIAKHNIASGQVSGIGVGVPGPVVDGRSVSRCVNLGWESADVATFMEENLGWKCKINNDANVAALGEAWKGASQNSHSSVMLTIGTGIGGGIIIDGEIINGFLGGGGEVGHMPIHPEVEGRVCGCGNTHCLELFAAAPALVAQYHAETGVESSAKEIFAAAKRGDGAALAVVDNMQRLMGRACAIISCVVNPEVFVIGGGVSRAGEFLLEGIQKYYDHYIFPPIKSVKFLLAALGSDAGIYGAARLVMD